MITVEEANQFIKENRVDFGIEEIPLSEGIGRVLREDISADRDFPPYDRVTMDGIAINYACFQNGQKEYPIAGVAAAGDLQKTLTEKEKCLEVMTGAIMPAGVDTVIPYELVNIENDVATLQTTEINPQQNIHFKGLDRKQGDVVIPKGIRISSGEVGVCATVGKATIKVSRLPKTIIISSGDELVDIHETPEAHQIRRSNVYRLETVMKRYQLDVHTAHILDDYDSIVKRLEGYLNEYELIVLSGGVSMGKFDFLPKALDELGVHKHFHKIKQRPGKPFWFGSFKDKATVFAFPGNPVSSFMCMQQYFKQWLNQSLQVNPSPQPMAKLTADVFFKPDLTYFLEVKLDYSEKGELLANPVKGNGSGDLANLVDADAFITLPRGRNEFKAGEVYPIIVYRD